MLCCSLWRRVRVLPISWQELLGFASLWEDNNVVLTLNPCRKQGIVHTWQSPTCHEFLGLFWGCLSIYLHFPLCCLKLLDGSLHLEAASNRTPLVLLSLRGLITHPFHDCIPFDLFCSVFVSSRSGLDACTFQHHFLP